VAVAAAAITAGVAEAEVVGVEALGVPLAEHPDRATTAIAVPARATRNLEFMRGLLSMRSDVEDAGAAEIA